MTAPAPPAPAAVAAFLRGADRRARLFARVQAGGQDAAAEQALQAVARVFASEAGQWPIAEWPAQFWRLLLSAPALRRSAAGMPGGVLPGVARLPPEQRAAVLLHLVAGLGEAEAAAALDIGVPGYQQRIRDALPRDLSGQPDIDVWRNWRAQAERELARMPEPPPVPAEKAGSALPPRGKSDSDPAFSDPAFSHRRRLRWLWLGVLLCALALAATFVLHPRGRALIDQWRNDVRVDALAAAEAPRARFDPADLALHPDHDLLAAPGELAMARQLPLLAWLANADEATPPGDAPLPPDAGPAAAATPPPTAAPAQTLAARMRAWDALSPRERGRQRGAWAAWRALAPSERHRLRQLAQRWQALAPPARHALRSRFDAQHHDVRHGGWLGPRLARDWPRVAPLFGFVPEAQRVQLLQLLAVASADDIDAFERLAQTTPPEEREAVRAALLQVPVTQRRAWVLARMQH
ncbi:hypothetical protein MASR1M8_06150 [Thermomonas brevis]